jgi:hypothetical protein
MASSKLPDEVLANAPNLIAWHEMEARHEQVDTSKTHFQRSSVNQAVSTAALGTPDDVRYSSIVALSKRNE